MNLPVELPDFSSLVFDSNQHESIIHPPGDFWIFAYGSLMWNPELEFIRSEAARLYGYHRCLCLWSIEYRGTPEHPGLVMGLDRGGSCLGRAFQISEEHAAETIAKLNRREMITGAYCSRLMPLNLANGEQVEGVCLFARRDHPQYTPRLPHKIIVELIRSARGKRGSNQEYVLNTVRHLEEMGMVDSTLQKIAALLKG